jgi:hypothetical protein
MHIVNIFPKEKSLLFLSLFALFLLILSMGVGESMLTPGQPFRLAGSPESGVSAANQGGMDVLVWIVRGLFAFVAIFLFFYITVSLFSKEGRKRLLADLLLLIMALLGAFFLKQIAGQNQMKPMEIMQPLGGEQAEWAAQDPPLQFSRNPPDWLTILVIFISTLVLVVIFYGVYWRFKLQKSHQSNNATLFAEEASNALRSLQAGESLEKVIINCYLEMVRLVREEKGLVRDQAMTVHEFELFLEGKGLPSGSLQVLTHLFEEVRYGAEEMGFNQEATAIRCLSEIEKSCRGVKNYPNAAI